MADKQTDANKAQALKEYREAQDVAIQHIVRLRTARLARDAAATAPKTKIRQLSPKRIPTHRAVRCHRCIPALRSDRRTMLFS
jgi:hypothetical protein